MPGAPEGLGNQPLSAPSAQHTRKLWKNYLENPQKLRDGVRNVLDCMKANEINLPVLLTAISPGGDQELSTDKRAVYQRTALLISDDFPKLLRVWHHRPKSHNKGKASLSTADVLRRFALETTHEIIEEEKSQLSDIFELSAEDVASESLLNIDLPRMLSETKRLAPCWWNLLYDLAYSKDQQENNQKSANWVRFLSYQQ
jgi:hypothetical protein